MAGLFFPQMSPDIFYPMLARVASPQQAEALRRIFHDPKKFAGEWILPSISRDDPLYPKQHYWRGKGECYENFLATTGEGSSDPHYTWGAMMVLIALEQWIDINPWHGLRFGNLEPVQEGAIERYHVAGSLYDVALSSRSLEVRRDGRILFAADKPVEIRQVTFEGGQVRFEVRTHQPVNLRAGSRLKEQLGPGVSRHTALL